MSTDHQVNHQELWKDGRYFAQIYNVPVLPKSQAADTLEDTVQNVVLCLLGDSYKLGKINPSHPSNGEGFEVYDVLSQLLPMLSAQSAFFWKRAARTLASMMASAKYPIAAQASHLVFWWARLGGLMGVTNITNRQERESECTSDGSPLEFSCVMPRSTDPNEANNSKIRFTIDPFHPVHGHRLAGGAALDWLWSDMGGMGLVKNPEGSKDWKDIIEKWLFPGIKDTEEIVDLCTYMIAFDLEPDGSITLKSYYLPPLLPSPGSIPSTAVTAYRLDNPLEAFKQLAKQLHPSIQDSFQILCDYLDGDGKDSQMLFVMIACDIVKVEKNRLKLYFISPNLKVKDLIHDMTLGGKLKGPRFDDAMENFKKWCRHLFPHSESDDSELTLEANIPGLDEEGRVLRTGVRVMYYYEFFVGESVPFPKIYFFMDHFSKNDLDTAKATEQFLRDVGKPGEHGWLPASLAHANPHRPLEKRNGLHTMASFGTKPSGWEITNYYSGEVYAPERDARDELLN